MMDGKLNLPNVYLQSSWCRYDMEKLSAMPILVGESNVPHDDVINENIFRVTGHLCGEFNSHR